METEAEIGMMWPQAQGSLGLQKLPLGHWVMGRQVQLAGPDQRSKGTLTMALSSPHWRKQR